MVEKDSAHVVEMAIEGEQASPRLIRPDLDLVVIPSRHEKWLRLVKIYSPYWSIMLFKPIYQGPHPVVP